MTDAETPRLHDPDDMRAPSWSGAAGTPLVRQLTAIMFTDMVGYTALMQVDEQRARAQRERQWTLLQEEVARHSGRILQAYGDGTLSVFRSAIEAVRCAMHVQAALAEEPRVPLRIGVHTGDIVHDGAGVYGDGVNVAARIQALATPGSILVSEKVFDELKNQPGIHTISLGTFQLKNVQRPLGVYAITGDALSVPDESDLSTRRARDARSVAVLPFVNMSADPENEYFSDGITEEIINALTRVPGLQVTARTSSFAFKNRHEDVRAIAGRLGVSAVLEGSVRKAGGRVRIAAQLIDARDGYHLFSEVYDRSLDDIFQTQDELSRLIVERLQEHLGAGNGSGTEAHAEHPAFSPHFHAHAHATVDDRGRLVRSHTHDTEAYTEYLKGRFHWNRWTPRDALLAITHLERSAEMDPTCALPFSALATAYTFLASIGHMPADDAYPRAAAFARQALEIENDAGESHLALAAVRLFYEWDFDGAFRSFQEALERTPGSAEAHHIYSLYLKAVGRLNDAIEEMETAVRLDPLSLPLNQTLGVTLFAADRVDEAEAQLTRTLELDPTFRAATEMLGWIRLRQDRVDDALRLWEQLPSLAANRFAGAGLRALAFARRGDVASALEMIDLLGERARAEPKVSLRMDYAVAYHGLGDLDEVFRQLHAAVDERLGAVVFLATSPNWRELRADPRFQALVRRIGIPAEVRP
jgi:TolB-like protein/tetratricopeptide (TPR) repeat protein